jgi:hypothetical protein
VTDADNFYLDFRATLSVMKSGVYAAITFLSDAFIVRPPSKVYLFI